MPLQLQVLGEPVLDALVAEPFRHLHVERRLRGQLCGLCAGGFHQVVGSNDLRDQALFERVGSGHVGGFEQNFQRPARPDHARQEVGHAPVGRGADPPVGAGDEGLLGGDPDVAGQRQRKARSGCGAVDRRDHRIGDTSQVDDRRVQRLGPAPHLRGQVDRVVFDAGFEAVDVAARAERLAGAGDDQRPQRRLVGEPGEGGPQIQDHLGAHRVEAVGAIEGEGADLAVDLDSQRGQLGGTDGLGRHLALHVWHVTLANWPGAYPLVE